MELSIADALAVACHIPEADVRVMNDAPIVFKGKVITEGILVFSRDEEFRIRYDLHAQDMYFDFLPTHRQLQAAFFRRLLTGKEQV